MRILENMLSPEDSPITLIFSEHDTARADPYCPWPAVTHPNWSTMQKHEVFVTRLMIIDISSHGLQTCSNPRCGERNKGGFTMMPVKANKLRWCERDVERKIKITGLVV